jgi:hypothetical protein
MQKAFNLPLAGAQARARLTVIAGGPGYRSGGLAVRMVVR